MLHNVRNILILDQNQSKMEEIFVRVLKPIFNYMFESSLILNQGHSVKKKNDLKIKFSKGVPTLINIKQIKKVKVYYLILSTYLTNNGIIIVNYVAV